MCWCVDRQTVFANLHAKHQTICPRFYGLPLANKWDQPTSQPYLQQMSRCEYVPNGPVMYQYPHQCGYGAQFVEQTNHQE